MGFPAFLSEDGQIWEFLRQKIWIEDPVLKICRSFFTPAEDSISYIWTEGSKYAYVYWELCLRFSSLIALEESL